MATTSSNLTAGKANMAQDGKGKRYKGRAAGLLAATALGLSLLVAGLGHVRQAITPNAGVGNAAAPRVAVALGDREDPRFSSGQPVMLAPHAVIALGDRDDPRFVGPVIARSTIADGTQPGLLAAMPGEPRIVAGLPPTRVKAGDLDGPRFLAPGTDQSTTPGYRQSHGLDTER